MISKIIFLVSLILYLMVFMTTSTIPSDGVMGSDLIQYNTRNRAYILGAVDTGRIVDLKGTYICEWSADHDQKDDEIVLTIINKIKQNNLLQAQPASFAVLNAYKQSYCLMPPKESS